MMGCQFDHRKPGLIRACFDNPQSRSIRFEAAWEYALTKVEPW